MALVRRYRKNGPWGGRTTEYCGRKIDRDVRTRKQIAEDEARFQAELDAIEPLPNHHHCDNPRCYCMHEGECCNDCLAF